MLCRFCRRKKQGAPLHADFNFEIAETDFVNVVIIYDHNMGNQSVTNDIECVLMKISSKVHDLGKHRIIYRDSMGYFDEIIVDNKGRFLAFHPIMPGERYTDTQSALSGLGING